MPSDALVCKLSRQLSPSGLTEKGRLGINQRATDLKDSDGQEDGPSRAIAKSVGSTELEDLGRAEQEVRYETLACLIIHELEEAPEECGPQTGVGLFGFDVGNVVLNARD